MDNAVRSEDIPFLYPIASRFYVLLRRVSFGVHANAGLLMSGSPPAPKDMPQSQNPFDTEVHRPAATLLVAAKPER